MVTYNRDIPAAPNNPSVDQPDMQVNTNAVDDILAVDHVSFNALNGGTHKQTTFSSKNVPGAQTDPQSVLYTNSGTASTVAEMFYRNQNATLPISAIKAFGVFSATGVNPALENSFNCTGATGSGFTFTVTLTANIVTGNNIVILAYLSNRAGGQPTLSVTSTFTNPVITFTFGDFPTGAPKVNFVVLQA